MNRALLSLLASALVIGGLFYAGYLEGVARCEAASTREKLAAVGRAIEQTNALAAQDAEVAETYEKTRVIREIRFRNIEKEVRHEVEKPVYRECNLDDCGLCLAAAAARGEAGTDCPCQPDHSLRGKIAGTPQRVDGGTPGGLHRDGATVPRLSGSAGGGGGTGSQPELIDLKP